MTNLKKKYRELGHNNGMYKKKHDEEKSKQEVEINKYNINIDRIRFESVFARKQFQDDLMKQINNKINSRLKEINSKYSN